MSITKRIEDICAFRLEAGKTIGSAWAWNGSTIQSLGANNAIPYINKSVKNSVLHAADDSIEGAAFQDLPVQTGIESPIDSFEGIVRYASYFDKILYWAFGYEDGLTSPVDVGGGYYSHLFELDKYDRHFTAYRTAEQTAVDYGATDRKNRAATFAFKKGPNDYRYRHVMCSSFRIFGDADDGMIRFSASGIAPREDRGDYDSDTWTFPSDAVGSSTDVLFRHLTASLKTQAGSFVDLGITNFDVNVDIPIQRIRDSESGLYLQEPVFEGKYNVTVTLTLTRHSTDAYHTLRDSFSSKQSLKLVAASGSYEFGIYLPEMYISDTFTNEESVPKQPITFVSGPVDADTANIFATEIGSNALIQEGPIFIMTQNQNSTNEMRRE